MAGSALLVPLYVYPFEGAWQPLYDAIAAHPQTQFLVVVNPYNGPGPDALPDANYCREVPKLRSHSNVAVFGYVHVQWAQRQLDTVLQDVETYAAWPYQHNHPHGPLQVDGIFVDETPFAADARTLDFLGRLTSMVRQNWPSHDTSGDTPTVWNPARTPKVRYTLSLRRHGSILRDASFFVVPVSFDYHLVFVLFSRHVAIARLRHSASRPVSPTGCSDHPPASHLRFKHVPDQISTLSACRVTL